MDIFGIIYKALNNLNKLVTSLRGVIDKKQNKLTYDDGSEITSYQDLFLDIVKEIPIEGTAFLYNKTGGLFQPILEDGSIKGFHNTRKIINIAEPIKGLYSGSKPDVIAVLSLNCAENFQAKDLFQDYYNLLEVRNIINGDYITDITQMFHNCKSLRHVDDYFSDNITDMSYAFFGTNKLKKLPELNTSKVTDFYATLQGSGAVKIPKSWNFNKAENLGAFASESKLENVEMSALFATNFDYAFQKCMNLTSIDIKAYKATSCADLCSQCYNLRSAKIFFETGKGIEAAGLFSNCDNLQSVDLSIYYSDFGNLIAAFRGCFNLKTITGRISINSKCSPRYTFDYCYSLEDFEGLHFPSDHKLYDSYSFADCSKLTLESMQSIMFNLNNQNAELIFNKEAYNRLTPEDIAVAVNKGWSVISANEY